VFLDLRIVKELRGCFSDLRILQGLGLERCYGAGRQAFELLFETTRKRIA
jgi:hypothetical protein